MGQAKGKGHPSPRAGGAPRAGGCFGSSVLEPQNGLGWKGPSRSSSSNPPAMSRDTFHQTRVLKALSNLALNPAREGAATASLGNLGQGFTTPRAKNFFLVSDLNLPSVSLKPSPLVPSLQRVMLGQIGVPWLPAAPRVGFLRVGRGRMRAEGRSGAGAGPAYPAVVSFVSL